jgi:uncharacterized membrane protein YgcG
MTTVSDSTNTLSPSSRSELEGVQSRSPVHIVFKESPSQAALGHDMDACIATPSTICIGVDPVHRWTSTRFGVDSGVRSGDFQQVARAGNLDFKQGDWAGGVKAIISRAEVLSVKSNAPSAVILQQPVIEHGVPAWPFVVGFGVLAIVTAWIIVSVRRRTQKALEDANKAIQDVRTEAAELAGKNIDEDHWGERLEASQEARRRSARHPIHHDRVPARHGDQGLPASPSTAASPSVVVVGGGGSPADFATGLLVGEALESGRGRRQRTPTPIPIPRREPTPAPSYSGGGDDSPSSSFSSGGDDSSFGGGGFDGGGGGGDFSGGGGDSSF